MNYLSRPFLLLLTLNEKISKAIAKIIKSKSKIWEKAHTNVSLTVGVEMKSLIAFNSSVSEHVEVGSPCYKVDA